MAITTATKPSGDTSTVGSKDFSRLALPTKKSTPSKNLADYLIFIYGQKKIGKTTLASQFPNAAHFFFEPGGKGIETYDIHPTSWAEFKYYIELLKNDEMFDNVIIDTVDIAWNMLLQDYCEKQGIDHINDKNDYGKSQDSVTFQFANVMTALQGTGKGTILLSHAKEVEIKTRNQGSWTRYVPTLKDRPAGWLLGAADVTAYYGYYGTDRRLVVDGSDLIEAGCRMKYNFRTPSGQRVVSIPMGASDEEAYANVMKAFANEQTVSGAEVHGIAPTMVHDLSAALKQPIKTGK